MTSDGRKHAVAVLVSRQPISPRGEKPPSCFVRLDFGSSAGGPLGIWERTIAASLIAPSVVVGSKVRVEYVENALGVLGKAVRIDSLLSSSPEEQSNDG